MTDNEALKDLVRTNGEISNNTYNLVTQFNDQLAIYDTQIMQYLDSGDKKQDQIIAQNNKIISGEVMIVMIMSLFVIYNFIVRCLK